MRHQDGQRLLVNVAGVNVSAAAHSHGLRP